MFISFAVISFIFLHFFLIFAIFWFSVKLMFLARHIWNYFFLKKNSHGKFEDSKMFWASSMGPRRSCKNMTKNQIDENRTDEKQMSRNKWRKNKKENQRTTIHSDRQNHNKKSGEQKITKRQKSRRKRQNKPHRKETRKKEMKEGERERAEQHHRKGYHRKCHRQWQRQGPKTQATGNIIPIKEETTTKEPTTPESQGLDFPKSLTYNSGNSPGRLRTQSTKQHHTEEEAGSTRKGRGATEQHQFKKTGSKAAPLSKKEGDGETAPPRRRRRKRRCSAHSEEGQEQSLFYLLYFQFSLIWRNGSTTQKEEEEADTTMQKEEEKAAPPTEESSTT